MHALFVGVGFGGEGPIRWQWVCGFAERIWGFAGLRVILYIIYNV